MKGIKRGRKEGRVKEGEKYRLVQGRQPLNERKGKEKKYFVKKVATGGLTHTQRKKKPL